MNKALFIFRRDFRLTDNNALYEAAKNHVIIPCFIFDPRQIEHNDFFSQNGFEFMIESLQELEQDLTKSGANLECFSGQADKIIATLLKNNSIQSVYVTRDYTPFSMMRDQQIEQVCLAHGVKFFAIGGNLLHEPEEIFTAQKDPYTVFTPFYRKSLEIGVAPVTKKRSVTWHTKPLIRTHLKKIVLSHELTSKAQLCTTSNSFRTIRGGRSHALAILKDLSIFKDYEQQRDIPAINTTHLSAHLKFGTVSPREVLQVCDNLFGIGSTLAKQLFWRDFYTHIAFHFPHVFNGAFKQKYNQIAWSYNKENFERWCYGQTGFPIVDAGMRELNQTGFMHNRVRMITASFLIKDLHLDWRLGERYFARLLVDYDPSVNNGNWQWVASTGCDPQPYFRIFNPWLQQKKFDPHGEYIKRWVPELINIAPRFIHNWGKNTWADNYPKPMLDHKIEAKIAIKHYKNL